VRSRFFFFPTFYSFHFPPIPFSHASQRFRTKINLAALCFDLFCSLGGSSKNSASRKKILKHVGSGLPIVLVCLAYSFDTPSNDNENGVLNIARYRIPLGPTAILKLRFRTPFKKRFQSSLVMLFTNHTYTRNNALPLEMTKTRL
jgi:hypothetical protein